MPCSFTSRAVSRSPRITAWYSDAPRLMRRAPAASSSATGKPLPFMPASTFTGLVTDVSSEERTRAIPSFARDHGVDAALFLPFQVDETLVPDRPAVTGLLFLVVFLSAGIFLSLSGLRRLRLQL